VTTPSLQGPQNTSAPTISGTATDGQTLTASPGTWTGGNPGAWTYVYNWQDCDSSGYNCSTVLTTNASATSTYKLSSSDVGHTIRVVVTASNGVGAPSATSAPTTVVQATAPVGQTPPVVTGVPAKGQTLSTTNGTWNGTTPSSYGYQWQDCDSNGNGCAFITGATSSSYTLTSSDVGHTVRSQVTASNAAGSAPQTSVQTAAVQSLGNGDFSDTCTSTAAKTVFDGYAGASYAKLIADQPSSQDTAVCYRIDQGSTQPGGRLDATTGSSASLPTFDTSYNACSTTSGNVSPVPPVKNTVLGTYTDQVATYEDTSGDVWLCLEADPLIGERVLAKEPGAGNLPSASIAQDSPPVGPPPPVLGPAGYPSTSCQSGSGNVRALDADIGGVQAWLYGWQESSTKLHLCARAQYPAQSPTQSAGGELTIDATGVPGVQIVGPTTSTSTSQCTQEIDTITLGGVSVDVKTSAILPTPANPAYVCVISPNLSQPEVIEFGTTGSPVPPAITWTPDPTP
jgi:hypothetical protein